MSKSRPTQNPSAFPSLVFRDVEFDVIDRNGQPWLRLPQIGVALGYANPYKVQQVYSRNKKEFTDAMTAVVKLPDLLPQVGVAGQVREVRIFSLRGAHLLGMIADAERAPEFRRWVLDVLDAEVAAQQASSAPTAEPDDPDADANFILLRYQGIKLRIAHMEGGYWYGAAALAKALGRRDAYLITGFLQPWQLSCVPCGNRHLQMVSHTGMLDLAGRFREGSELLVWLERKIPHVFSAASAPLPTPTPTPTPEPVNPFAGVTGDARQLAFDYFNQCRQAVTDAGGQVPHWDASAEQRIADGLAALLLERHRYVLNFGEGGAPQLKAVPFGSVVIDPVDGDRLARLVWEQVPVEALPTIMEAACRRLARLAGGGR